jgi:hypothetical protein
MCLGHGYVDLRASALVAMGQVMLLLLLLLDLDIVITAIII